MKVKVRRYYVLHYGDDMRHKVEGPFTTRGQAQEVARRREAEGQTASVRSTAKEHTHMTRKVVRR